MKRIHFGAAMLSAAILFLPLSPPIHGEDKNDESGRNLSCIPMAMYEGLTLGEQEIYSPGFGLAFAGKDSMTTAFYTAYLFDEPLLFEYPETYHSVDVLFDGKTERGNWLLLFSSSSDEPAYGGLRTFQAAGVYGWKLIEGQRGSLILGGGLAVSDFGIENADGEPWPLIPVPFLRASFRTSLLSSSFDFITGPNLNIVLMPERKVRLVGDFRMDEFRDARDLIFETYLLYQLGFAGISVGFKNDALSFDLGEEDERLEVHYHALFACVDLAVLKLSAGYAFDARERYREEYTRDIEAGLFLSLQGLYQF